MEKIAAFAPMPSASESTAMAVTNGVFSSIRAASLILRIDGRDWGRNSVDFPALDSNSPPIVGKFRYDKGERFVSPAAEGNEHCDDLPW